MGERGPGNSRAGDCAWLATITASSHSLPSRLSVDCILAMGNKRRALVTDGLAASRRQPAVVIVRDRGLAAVLSLAGFSGLAHGVVVVLDIGNPWVLLSIGVSGLFLAGLFAIVGGQRPEQMIQLSRSSVGPLRCSGFFVTGCCREL